MNLVKLSAYEIFIKHCHKNDRFVHVSFVLQKHHFESKSEKLLIGKILVGKIHQSVKILVGKKFRHFLPTDWGRVAKV